MLYVVLCFSLLVFNVALIAVFGGTIGGMIDVPSVFVVASTFFMVLLSSGGLRDFFVGLRIAVSKKEYPALQIARSETAVSLVMQAVPASAGMVLFLCLSMLLSIWKDTGSFGPVMALALLSLFYSGELVFFLLFVKNSLKRKKSLCRKERLPNREIVLSKVPCIPYVSFVCFFPVLFFLLSIEDTFLLSNYMDSLSERIPLLCVFVVFLPYIALLLGRSFVPYMNALSCGFKRRNSLSPAKLSEARAALNFAMLVRFSGTSSAAILMAIGTLSTLESAEQAFVSFSYPLFLLSIPFALSLLHLPLRARIENALLSYQYPA